MSKKISELTDASDLDGSEQLEVVQSGSNKKTTINDLPSIYTKDGTIDASETGGVRSIQLNGYDLAIKDSNLQFFYIIRGAENQKIFLASYDETGVNNSQLYLQTNSDIGYEFALTTFNGANTVSLEGNADENVLEYNAANHVFPDVVAKDFADDAAAASGGVPVGGLYHTSGTLKIRLI